MVSDCHSRMVTTAVIFAFIIASFLHLLPWQGNDPVWCDAYQKRSRAIVAKMSLEEKISLLSGTNNSMGYTGYNPGLPHLNVSQIRCNDGPQGFRGAADTATQWPSSLHVGASWDTELALEWGVKMAREFRGKGANCFLGPGVNVHRVPLGGRNWEYITGEEPIFGFLMAKAVVEGIQSQDVFAVTKHYILNNQEHARLNVSAVVSPLAFHEMYSVPFVGAFAGGSGSFMCSYNRVNGTYSCENRDTLGWIQRRQCSFVMSDWGATQASSFKNLLDMAMASDSRFQLKEVLANIKAGNYTEEEVTSKAQHIVATLLATRQDTHFPANGSLDHVVTSPAHDAFNKRLVIAGTVMLLKGPLPLRKTAKVKYFRCDDGFVVHGGGSGQVLQKGSAIADAAKALGSMVEVIDRVEAVTKNDTVVVCLSVPSREGLDRADLRLNDTFMTTLKRITPFIVVVISCPGVVLMPWAENDFRGGILLSFFPGAQAANALSEILYGISEPQGRLPVTIPFEHAQLQFEPNAYPGVNGTVEYSEELAVGRRWFQSHEVLPLFAYGSGASWTHFGISVITVSTFPGTNCLMVKLGINVTNIGSVDGHEVLQIYARMENRPFTQLAGFRKVFVPAGDSIHLIHVVELRVWTYDRGWRSPIGMVALVVGNSSDAQGHSDLSVITDDVVVKLESMPGVEPSYMHNI